MSTGSTSSPALVVEINYHGTGKWMTATVIRTHKDDTVDVQYEKLNETERRVPVDRIRPHHTTRTASRHNERAEPRERSKSPPRSVAEEKSRSKSPPPIDVKPIETGQRKNDDAARHPVKPASEGSAVLIEVNYRGLGVWAPARLTKENKSGTVDVLYYKSGEVENDVPIDRIRPATTAAAAGTEPNPRPGVSSSGSNGSSKNRGETDQNRNRIRNRTEVQARTDQVKAKAVPDIEALYHGKKNDWRAARIIKEHKNNTVDVIFVVEGEEQHAVPVTSIRLAGTAAAAIEVGTMVEVNYRNRGVWLPGTVRRDRKDDTYDIKYEEDDEFETRVPRDRIRLARPSTGVKKTAKVSTAARPQTADESTRKASKSPGDENHDDKLQLSKQEVDTLKKLIQSKDAEIQKLKGKDIDAHQAMSPSAPKSPPPTDSHGRNKRAHSLSGVEEKESGSGDNHLQSKEKKESSSTVPKLEKKRSQDDIYIHKRGSNTAEKRSISELPGIAVKPHGDAADRGSATEKQVQQLIAEVAKLTKANGALVTGMQTLTKKLSSVVEEVGTLRSRTDRLSKTVREQEQEIAELKGMKSRSPEKKNRDVERSTGAVSEEKKK